MVFSILLSAIDTKALSSFSHFKYFEAIKNNGENYLKLYQLM